MRIIKVKDYDDMSKKAASIISSQVNLYPGSTLGLATGSTVEGIYENLALWHKQGILDFSKLKTVNLDEYVGLSTDHPQSYNYFMKTNLFEKVNIDPDNTNLPDGMADDLNRECRRYEEIINGFFQTDIQLLGLGTNGHIGFNEPSDRFEAVTHCVDLTAETISSNARFFKDENEVPKKAITMGIGSIVRAKSVLLCVNGAHKADALNRVLAGPVMPQVPGSILQFHPNLIVVADEDALSLSKL